jgi:hypothetical protein
MTSLLRSLYPDRTFSKNYGKRFLAMHAEDVSVRKSKRTTLDRAKDDQMMADMRDWAPRYEKMLLDRNGNRLKAHQLMNWDACTFYIEPDSAGQMRIFANKGTPRSNHKAMSRSAVAQIAPVIVADSSTLVIFVNIKANFGTDYSGTMEEQKKSGAKKLPAKYTAKIDVDVPVLMPGTRSNGCPVYYIYSKEGAFTQASFEACTRITHQEYVTKYTRSADVLTDVDLVSDTTVSPVEYRIIVDNCSAHRTLDFISKMWKLGMGICFGFKGGTHIWQPLDAEPNAVAKNIFRPIEQKLTDAWVAVAPSDTAGYRAALQKAAVDAVKVALSPKVVERAFRTTFLHPDVFTVDSFVAYARTCLTSSGVAEDSVVNAATNTVFAYFFAANQRVDAAKKEMTPVKAVVARDYPYAPWELVEHQRRKDDEAREEQERKRRKTEAAEAEKRATKEEKEREKKEKELYNALHTCIGIECSSVYHGGQLWLTCSCDEKLAVRVCPKCRTQPEARAAFNKHMVEMHAPPTDIAAKGTKGTVGAVDGAASSPTASSTNSKGAKRPASAVDGAAMAQTPQAPELASLATARPAGRRTVRIARRFVSVTP